MANRVLAWLNNLVWGLLTTGGTAATFVPLNLGLNAAPIGGCADCWEVRSDCIDQAILHSWVGIIQGCLNDIVGEGVSEKAVELAGLQHLLNQHIL